MGTKIGKLVKKLRSFLPSHLPIGMAQFEEFAESIFETWDIPNNESYRHSIATMIMHLDPTRNTKPKYYFVKAIRKAQANEIAFAVIEGFREAKKQRNSLKREEDSLPLPGIESSLEKTQQ